MTDDNTKRSYKDVRMTAKCMEDLSVEIRIDIGPNHYPGIDHVSSRNKNVIYLTH